MVSPVIHMRRTALEDAEVNGQLIAKDEKLVLWYGAANRDPDIFPRPDVFDMHRDNVEKHLAFGHGVHKCLGSRIAKMQLRLAFERIFERFYSDRSRAPTMPQAQELPASGHSGLGLSISRQIARAHGGDLVADNRPDGVGAFFTLILPRDRSPGT